MKFKTIAYNIHPQWDTPVDVEMETWDTQLEAMAYAKGYLEATGHEHILVVEVLHDWEKQQRGLNGAHYAVAV